MKIIPLAFESLGTRSMATLVETVDCRIVIDPGVALGPWRYGLRPHELELERLTQHWREIKTHSQNSDVLIITHYHYDHHNPREPQIFRDKIVLLKHPEKNINFSQKRRSAYFLKQIEGLPREVLYCDGKSFDFGNTTITFSQPVFHGIDSKLGYVTEIAIKEGKDVFLHTSDIEGPSLKDQTLFIIENDPHTIFCDGPLTYMLNTQYPLRSLQDSIQNIMEIIDKTRVKKFVLDHHFLRDIQWRERIKDLLSFAESKGLEIISAAEFKGLKKDLLEARRKELWETIPPTQTQEYQDSNMFTE
ncbi:MAG: hypothetical protein Q6366_013685 [Candidatus Freyarchaeota archaeon]